MTQSDDKTFASLQAEFAFVGHELTRTILADGTAIYAASHWGCTRPLLDLDEARKLLKQIGGF
jgi:hypothetical protein